MKIGTLDFSYFLLLWSFCCCRTAQAINLCGDPSTDDCLMTCHNNCKNLHSSGSGMTDEKIATEKNLCDSKCFGLMYNPSRELGDGKFIHHPGYFENEKCMGICAYPSPNYCQEGYLSQFFYCDCHSCCLQNPDKVARVKCAEACHLWFMKQWSPKTGKSCRWRESYSLTKNEWCSAYCAWQMITIQSGIPGNANIQSIVANPLEPCIKKCSSLISAGIPVDYDRRPLCTSPYQCVAAHIKEFFIVTPFEENEIKPYFVEHLIGGQSYYEANNVEVITVTSYWKFYHTWRHAVENSIPEALINMKRMGINITLEPGRNLLRIVNPGSSYILERDRRVIEELLRKSYRKDKQWTPGKVEETVIFETFPNNYSITIPSCTEYNNSHTHRVVTKFPVEYEVHITLSDPTGGLPFTGYDMPTLLAQTPQFSGLDLVQNIDNTTLEMKWRSRMLLTFLSLQYSGTLGYFCRRIPGCGSDNSKPHCQTRNEIIVDYKKYYGESSG